jgi:hypothetical protein
MAKIDTTVGKLVDMISDGDLRLPEMQRRYVWPATRVRDLPALPACSRQPSPLWSSCPVVSKLPSIQNLGPV